jgi:hypothetical protein
MPPTIAMRLAGEECVLGALPVENPHGTLTINNDGMIIDVVKGSIYNGKIRGRAEMSRKKDMSRTGVLSVTGIDLQKMYESSSKNVGDLSGFADVRLSLDSLSPDADSQKCTGQFVLRKLSLDRVPVLSTIVVSLAVPRLSKLYFSRVQGDIAVEGERITCTDIQGEGRPVDIESSGWAKTDGTFNFNLACAFNAEYEDSLSSLAWNAMIPQDNGGRRFECVISGAWDNPRVKISRTIKRRAVRNVFQNFRRELKAIFK